MFRFRKRPTANSGSDEFGLVQVKPLQHRRFMRTPFQMPAQLNLAGKIQDVQLLDISLKGAFVDVGKRLVCNAGTHGRLRIRLSATSLIAMDVVVARTTGQCIGLECRHMDLDSVTNLRQLLTHNLQDPALLTRELSLLMEPR
ncbi:PilZ domain-containing protein [Curvibacter sp. CHRR-16]|uniref:PilZ domain-containing protein n=1 Tax=Curvibacter sp. CHRR-16 TaxID=2835872 RepID=UPI001BDB1808|nr:PilZ domain-containing protein [Curvibacter sp. CHRR-16]MBT0569924.1 PilZ domain-containing protein [Curvibacter sp. CHRR-16]